MPFLFINGVKVEFQNSKKNVSALIILSLCYITKTTAVDLREFIY